MADLTIWDVRCNWVQLLEPGPEEYGSKYSVQMLIRKDDEFNLGRIREAIMAVGYRKGDRQLMDGDDEANGKGADYQDHWYANANSRRKPVIVGPDGQPASMELIDAIGQSGCFFNISAGVYRYDVSGNRGIGFGLNMVQLLRGGDRMGGPPTAQAAFGSPPPEIAARLAGTSRAVLPAPVRTEDDLDDDIPF